MDVYCLFFTIMKYDAYNNYYNINKYRANYSGSPARKGYRTVEVTEDNYTFTFHVPVTFSVAEFRMWYAITTFYERFSLDRIGNNKYILCTKK